MYIFFSLKFLHKIIKNVFFFLYLYIPKIIKDILTETQHNNICFNFLCGSNYVYLTNLTNLMNKISRRAEEKRKMSS